MTTTLICDGNPVPILLLPNHQDNSSIFYNGITSVSVTTIEYVY